MKIKVGIAGYGERGKIFARRLREIEKLRRLYDLIGAYDIDPSRRIEFTRNGYAQTFFVDLEEMFKCVDAVIDTTSSGAHYATTSAALKAGKNVLVEKPSTLSYAQDIEIERLALKNGRLVAVGYIEIFNPALQTIMRDVNPEDINFVFSIRYGPKPVHRRSDPGITYDLLSHCTYSLTYWTKKEPKIIYSEEDAQHGFLMLRYDNLDAHLHGRRITDSKFRHRLAMFYGNDNYYIADYAAQKLIMGGTSEVGPIHPEVFPRLTWLQQVKLSENVETPVPIERQEPLELLLKLFAESIEKGEVIPPLPSISESKRTTKVLEEAKKLAITVNSRKG